MKSISRHSLMLLIVFVMVSACSKDTLVDKEFIDCESELVLEQITPLPSSYDFLPFAGSATIEFRDTQDGRTIEYLITEQEGEQYGSVICFVDCPEDGESSIRVQHNFAYKSRNMQSLNQSELAFPMHRISIMIQAIEDYQTTSPEGQADILSITTFDQEQGSSVQMRKVVAVRDYPGASSKEIFTYHETLDLEGMLGYSDVYESINADTGLRVFYHLTAGVVVMVEEDGTTWERVYND